MADASKSAWMDGTCAICHVASVGKFRLEVHSVCFRTRRRWTSKRTRLCLTQSGQSGKRAFQLFTGLCTALVHA